MTTKKLPLLPATYISTDAALSELVPQLAKETLLAVDTESNSLYAYQERVCLIQLSTRSQDYILDPLAIRDIEPLAPIFADARIEKVFHAAEYDVMCLKRDFGFTFNNMFDTLVAARICGLKSISLSALLEENFQVKLDKSHQKDNWRYRPLPVASLRYAQMDTHYLPALRDIFYEELKRLRSLPEAQEQFAELCHLPSATTRTFDPAGFWAIGNPAELTRREMAILRELVLLREDIAQERDCPPFKVFSNKTLIDIAQQEPRNQHELRSIASMPTSLARRYGARLVRAVEHGRANRLPPPPVYERPNPVINERYALLHTWRKERAEQRGVESDVIVSKQALWEVARLAPTTLDELSAIPGLGPWRLETYGAELLSVVERFPNGSGK